MGYAHKSHTIYEMPRMSQMVMAEKSNRKRLINNKIPIEIDSLWGFFRFAIFSNIIECVMSSTVAQALRNVCSFLLA